MTEYRDALSRPIIKVTGIMKVLGCSHGKAVTVIDRYNEWHKKRYGYRPMMISTTEFCKFMHIDIDRYVDKTN